jgi:hypothetical protein
VSGSVPRSVDPTKIQEVLDGRWAHVRRDARENLNDPDFLPVYGETMQEARERVTRAAKILEEEADRQEAMAARDDEVRSEAEGRQASPPTWRSPRRSRARPAAEC